MKCYIGFWKMFFSTTTVPFALVRFSTVAVVQIIQLENIHSNSLIEMRSGTARVLYQVGYQMLWRLDGSYFISKIVFDVY